ncbi:hypothetical protein PFISCL1PPCAC_28695, partial [Pristionchus fissidentatus]
LIIEEETPKVYCATGFQLMVTLNRNESKVAKEFKQLTCHNSTAKDYELLAPLKTGKTQSLDRDFPQ